MEAAICDGAKAMQVSDRDRRHFARIADAFAAVEAEDRAAAAGQAAGEKVLAALGWSDTLRGVHDAAPDEIAAQGSLKARWLARHVAP